MAIEITNNSVFQLKTKCTFLRNVLQIW